MRFTINQYDRNLSNSYNYNRLLHYHTTRNTPLHHRNPKSYGKNHTFAYHLLNAITGIIKKNPMRKL